MDQQRWQQLMQALQFADNDETYHKLYQAYSEPHRYYHSAAHIEDCLTKLDSVREQAQTPAHIELAIWFHDAIYKPLSSSNEIDSAQWAYRFVIKQPASDVMAQQIYTLVMATVHNAPVTQHDMSLLVDIDLSILGADSQRYNEFEQQIRQEYSSVPTFIFRRKRKSILQSFLSRARIFQHEYFYQLYEQQARSNLRNAIDSL